MRLHAHGLNYLHARDCNYFYVALILTIKNLMAIFFIGLKKEDLRFKIKFRTTQILKEFRAIFTLKIKSTKIYIFLKHLF